MTADAAFQVLSFRGDGSTVRQYVKRKLHRKTKNGCASCRAKRVKCDESRPICMRCRRNYRTCVYGRINCYAPEVHLVNDEVNLSSPAGFAISNTVTLVPSLTATIGDGTSSMHLVQHLHRHWTDIFPIPKGYELLSLFKSDQLIRNTVLAVSASHLRHVLPGVLQHRIAEHFQQSLAIQDYQNALYAPADQLGQRGINNVMLSGTLLNMLAFALPESEIENIDRDGSPDPSSSWVFSEREDRLDWLGLQVGIKSMVISYAPYLDRTLDFLGQIFMGPDKEDWGYGGIGPADKDLPMMWVKFFELRDFDEEKRPTAKTNLRNIFRPPVRALIHLRKVKPVRTNVFKYLQFLGKVNPQFRDLLSERDKRALWLYGFWLGLMCRFEGMWWCEKRVRRDYKAIHMWLQELRLTHKLVDPGNCWTNMMREFESAPFYV